MALCYSPSGFSEDSDGKNVCRTQVVKAERDMIILSFPELPVGKYAIAAFLDSNFFGIPVKHYGFSKNARSPFKKPSIEDAVFEVGNESTYQMIHLK